MKHLEELSMNAFPSIQTVLYDGWILRFADGYSNRANSVNPIYPSTWPVTEKINRCECIYGGHDLKATYKITPFVYPEDLDHLLDARGYRIVNPTSVQTLDLTDIGQPELRQIETVTELDEQWLACYFQFNRLNDPFKRDACRKILGNIIPDKYFVRLRINDEDVACGLAVREEDWVGLFDITVAENCRNQGYGKQLMLNLMNLGKQVGAKNAYLQVMLNNPVALHLYESLGFREAYQYHYRVMG